MFSFSLAFHKVHSDSLLISTGHWSFPALHTLYRLSFPADPDKTSFPDPSSAAGAFCVLFFPLPHWFNLLPILLSRHWMRVPHLYKRYFFPSYTPPPFFRVRLSTSVRLFFQRAASISPPVRRKIPLVQARRKAYFEGRFVALASSCLRGRLSIFPPPSVFIRILSPNGSFVVFSPTAPIVQKYELSLRAARMFLFSFQERWFLPLPLQGNGPPGTGYQV